MIVRDTSTIQDFISINASVQYETLKPYITLAERKNIKALIGQPQYAVFDVSTPPADATVLEAYHLAQEAICNFAMYYALPILKTQISESGLFVSQNQDVATSSDKDYKELLRSFKTQGHEALDELFLLMEANFAKFTAWTASEVYQNYNNCLVKNTATFNKHYHIFNSRQTFMALKPELEVVERQYFNAVFGKELLTALKANQTNANRKEVKGLLEKAMVFFTIAKVMQNGLFQITASGITAKFNLLPYEVIKDVSSEHLKESQKNKITEAEQLLKDAVEIITENAADFIEYTAPVASETAETSIIVTKGITMI